LEAVVTDLQRQACVALGMEIAEHPLEHLWQRARGSEVVGEPVMLRELLVAPTGPVGHGLVYGLVISLQGGGDRRREPIGLQERIADATTGCRVLEMSSVSRQYPARA